MCMLGERKLMWKISGTASPLSQGPNRLSQVLEGNTQEPTTFSRWSLEPLKAQREKQQSGFLLKASLGKGERFISMKNVHMRCRYVCAYVMHP